MNPSTALAVAVVGELAIGGVREAVLSPGSRNAPLAYAFFEADRLGLIRLHVRIDERSAGFLALGLAKASRHPVVVTTTSGTAAVNLHPAIVEADYSGVPVVALTADRPVELRGTGANQTIDQTELYGESVRAFLELSLDTAPTEVQQRAAIRSALDSAGGRGPVGPPSWGSVVSPSFGSRGFLRDLAGAGPVHVNVGLREPLVPDGGLTLSADVSPSAGSSVSEHHPMAYAQMQVTQAPDPAAVPATARPSRDALRTVVVAGDGAGASARFLAEAGGWPLLAEPSSNARSGPNAMTAYRLYLDELAGDIERVIVLGRPTLSRPVGRLLARRDIDVVRDPSALRDMGVLPDIGRPDLDGVRAAAADRNAVPRAEPDRWLLRWQDADTAARRAVTGVLETEPTSGPAIAAVVTAALPVGALLVAGSSSAVRDLDLAPRWDDDSRVDSETDHDPAAPVNVASAHVGPAHVAPAHVGPAHVAPAHVAPAHVAPAHVAPANPARPLDRIDPAHAAPGPRVLANRGASGIDGTVSTAIGAALAHQRSSRSGLDTVSAPAYALIGDLTFLHDANGLVIGPDEPRPDLTIVVVNDDGGGLFTLLEQGEPDRAGAFERVFGTPHGVDIAALCSATQTPYVRAETLADLRHHLTGSPSGIRVVEIRTDRTVIRDLHARLRGAVAAAVAALPV